MMSLSGAEVSTSPAPGVAAAVSAALLNSSISRMEDHLLTRFHHIDPELVDEYMSGRRRQVSCQSHQSETR